MSPATDAEIIDWQLRFLEKNSDTLSEGEINLLISFEKQFEARGKLSARQMEILDEIYKRRT